MVSALALNILYPTDGSLAHDGIKPQRINDKRRLLYDPVITGIFCPGAIL